MTIGVFALESKNKLKAGTWRESMQPSEILKSRSPSSYQEVLSAHVAG